MCIGEALFQSAHHRVLSRRSPGNRQAGFPRSWPWPAGRRSSGPARPAGCPRAAGLRSWWSGPRCGSSGEANLVLHAHVRRVFGSVRAGVKVQADVVLPLPDAQFVGRALAQGLQSIQKLTIGGGVLHGVFLLRCARVFGSSAPATVPGVHRVGFGLCRRPSGGRPSAQAGRFSCPWPNRRSCPRSGAPCAWSSSVRPARFRSTAQRCRARRTSGRRPKPRAGW